MSQPDPKSPARIRDANLLRRLHWSARECELCGETCGLSLHHVLKHPRDDVSGNIVVLCGSGTTGCHGEIEAHDGDASAGLGELIVTARPDIVEHMTWRLGSRDAADAWLRRYLYASLP